MANEISLSANLTVRNGNWTGDNVWQETNSYNQNTLLANGGIMATSTTAATIPVGSVATLGYLMVKNLDSTNNIGLGIVVSAAYQAFGLLKPNEVGVFRLATGITLQAKAAAGTPSLQYLLLND